ncbi:GSCOCG00012964001-RA-CDS [Cotesia congregata]|nr:GSCOCG00012964001-RA-CDS [Cotesia congregata]
MLSLPLPQKNPTLQSSSIKDCKSGKKKEAIMSQKPQESKLTDDEIEFLILEAQSRPPLWNHETPLANRSLKATDLLWEEVSKAMDYRLSAADCKKRFKSLKDQYRKQVQAECRSSGSARINQKKWKFYDACSFMRDCFLIKPTVGNVPGDDFHNSGVEGDGYMSEDEAKNNNNTTPVNRSSRKRTNNGSLDNNMSPLAMIAAKICKDSPPLTLPSTPKIDAVDNFLAGVGHEIRKLPEDKHLGVIML